MHMAPGEAEAECALLQREGIVDAVLSEDVDTLMFGSKITIRNWSSQDKGKTPTHVNLYDADVTKISSGLDRDGMILVALMSGGDYIPQGIPGCGPKIACEAARAGFGRDLCKIRKNDSAGYSVWREHLSQELKTNESKHFKMKHKTLTIPDDFPSTEILGYYTQPAISTIEKASQLKQTLAWDHDLNFQELREFTRDAFDWRCVGGAKKFIRNLAQSLLIRELRLGDKSKRRGLVQGIHGLRTHASTDGITELRISYIPIEVVNIDLSIEPPDDEIQVEQLDMQEDEADGDEQIEPSSTQTAKSKPYLYDPTQMEKIWIPEAFVKIGEPEKYGEWEARMTKLPSKANKTAAPSNARGYRTKAKGVDKTMPKGALNSFIQVTKSSSPVRGSNPRRPKIPKDNQTKPIQTQLFRAPPPPRPTTPTTPTCEVINLLSSSPVKHAPTPITIVTPTKIHDWLDLPATITKRRKRSPLRRAHTYANNQSIDKFFRDKESNELDIPVLNLVEDKFENTPKRSKQWVRPRQSMAGAFAIEDGTPREQKRTGALKLDEVFILDLT